MTNLQIIPGDFEITDPTWPRIQMWRPGKVFTSDTFITDGEPVGSVTSATLGGQQMVWKGNPGIATVGDGHLTFHGPGSGYLMMDPPGADMDIEITLVALPTAGTTSVVARRDALAFSDLKFQVEVQISTTGYITINERFEGSLKNLGASGGNRIAAGSKLTVRLQGPDVQVFIDGMVVGTVQTRVLNPAMVGFGIPTNSSGASIGDFKLTAL